MFDAHQMKGGLMEKSFRLASYVIGLVLVAILVQSITQAKMQVLRVKG